MKNPKFEKYIHKIIEKYAKVLLLDHSTFEVKYGVNDERSLMESCFNYPYLSITVKYSDDAIKKWKNKEDVVPIIIHELCHPITDPLYSKACDRYVSKGEINDERERLTDYIANIIVKNKL